MAGTPLKKMNRRSSEEIARDRTKISYLLLQGMKPTAIADVLDKPVSAIAQEINAIEHEWLEERVLNHTALVNRELHRLAHLEMRAWQAFDKSGEPVKITRTRTRTGERKKGGGAEVEKPPDMAYIGPQAEDAPPETTTMTDNEATVRIEEKNSDPRYLMVIERIIEQRIRLLGLEAAGPEEDPNNVEPINQIEVYVVEDYNPRHSSNGQAPERQSDTDEDAEPDADFTQADVIDVLPALGDGAPTEFGD